MIVITGTFNFTKAAEEKNAENLLIIRSKELAKSYLDNWQHHPPKPLIDLTVMGRLSELFTHRNDLPFYYVSRR